MGEKKSISITEVFYPFDVEDILWGKKTTEVEMLKNPMSMLHRESRESVNVAHHHSGLTRTHFSV